MASSGPASKGPFGPVSWRLALQQSMREGRQVIVLSHPYGRFDHVGELVDALSIATEEPRVTSRTGR